MTDEKQIRNTIELYIKERKYQSMLFGKYEDDKSLSLPSFLIFLKTYVDKALQAYSGKWQRDLPPWLKGCAEYKNHGVAPVKAYEELIKIRALAGAALETYTDIDVAKWREDPEKDIQKWKNKGDDDE